MVNQGGVEMRIAIIEDDEITRLELSKLFVIRQIKRCRFHQIKTGLSEHLTMG